MNRTIRTSQDFRAYLDQNSKSLGQAKFREEVTRATKLLKSCSSTVKTLGDEESSSNLMESVEIISELAGIQLNK